MFLRYGGTYDVEGELHPVIESSGSESSPIDWPMRPLRGGLQTRKSRYTEEQIVGML
jgi:hypothetical protein